MTREEKADHIRAGQKAAWEAGRRWGYQFTGDLAERERVADAVQDGEISCRAGAKQLGIAASALSAWMKRRGYRMKNTNKPLHPTKKDLRALREYWARDCTLTDVCQYTGHSYLVVRRWIDEGYGKE